MKFNKEAVKKLRKITNAPITLCVEALKECKDDITEAQKYLREKGILKTQDMAARDTSQGLCRAMVSSDKKSAVIIKLLCETDFVAKNADFIASADKILKAILNNCANFDVNKPLKELNNVSVSDFITDLSAKVGEKVLLDEFEIYQSHDNNFCVAYNHHNAQNACVLQVCGLNLTNQIDVFKNIAMQISALKPKYIAVSEIDEDFIANEKKIIAQLVNENNDNKPQKVIDKIIEGRLNKQLQDFCLLTQSFIKDNKLSVKQYLKNNNISETNLLSFVRFEI